MGKGVENNQDEAASTIAAVSKNGGKEETDAVATAVTIIIDEKETLSDDNNNNNNNNNHLHDYHQTISINEKKKVIQFESITESDGNEPKKATYPFEIVWFNVFKLGILHLGTIWAVYLIPSTNDATIAFTYLLMVLTIFGVQAGAHRLVVR